MRFLRNCCLVGLAAALFATVPAWAGQVYTVGGDTGKSIADGVAQLHPGDTLSILSGTYHAAITVPCDDVTIEGAGPGVVLEAAVTLTAADFTPAPDRPGVFTWPLPTEATDTRITWIFVNGQPLNYQKAPLNPAKQAWAFYVDQPNRRLEMVGNGKNFPANATITVPTLGTMVDAEHRRQVTVRGLEIHYPVTGGINVGPEGRIEDNLVTYAGMYGVDSAERSVILRNTAKHCSGPGILVQGDGVEIQDNLCVANGMQWSDYISWCGTETKTNVRSSLTFEQNWLVDRPKGGLVKVDGQTAMDDGKPVVKTWMLNSGLWPDGDSFNNNYIDNAIARLSHAGIYIEFNADRNVIMANDVQDCAMGITMRQASQNLVTRNWVWDRECLGWGKVDKEGFAGYGPGYKADGTLITQLYQYEGEQKDPAANKVVAALGSSMWGQQMDDGLSLWHTYADMTPTSHDNVMTRNLVQVSGMAVSVPLFTYDWPSAQERNNAQQLMTLSNQLTDNYYTRPANAAHFALLGRTLVKSFADYQQLTGWDGNAHVGAFTPAVIGLEPIWTIPGLAVDTQTPVSILHDPSFETGCLQSSSEPLFWHGSCMRSPWDNGPATRYQGDGKLAHSGRSYISASNAIATDAVPIWWTSSAIPVKPGTTMGVNVWVAADDIKAGKVGDGVRVNLRFTDATGHLVGESALIGADAHPELLTGTYNYTNLNGQSVVPPDAYWMTVNLGVDPSTGTVRFDDVHINLRNPVPPQFAAAK
jgi:hypothetical protein